MAKIFDSIIFDLDGTLWDAVGTYAKSWNIYFKKNGINKNISKEYLDQLMGLEEKAYLEKVIPEFFEKHRTEIYKEVINIQYELVENEGGYLYNGVLEGLKKLSKSYRLFIISNCPGQMIKYFMKWCNIEKYITDTISHGENFKLKHENIRLFIEKHGLSKPVYAGDTDSDRKQCELAVVPFIFMNYGFGKCENYLLKFESFDDFTNYMTQ